MVDLDPRVGMATDTVHMHPQVNAAGDLYVKPGIERRGIGNGRYIVMDGVPASFDVEAVVKELGGKGQKPSAEVDPTVPIPTGVDVPLETAPAPSVVTPTEPKKDK